MITNQEIFNTVVTKLRKQNKKSVGLSKGTKHGILGAVNAIEEICLYRGPNGIKCAAGHMIPDPLYKDSWEGLAIFTICQRYSVEQIFGDKIESLELVEGLQIIHDDYNIEDWEQEWENIAHQFNLKIPERISGEI